MKKNLLITVFCFISAVLFSQTSMQDWKYMKKGYWVAESNGFEKRKDRVIVNIETLENKEAKVNIMQLCKNDSTGRLCYSVLISLKAEDKSYYIAIPSPKSEDSILNEFQMDCKKLNETARYYFIMAMLKITRF